MRLEPTTTYPLGGSESHAIPQKSKQWSTVVVWRNRNHLGTNMISIFKLFSNNNTGSIGGLSRRPYVVSTHFNCSISLEPSLVNLWTVKLVNIPLLNLQVCSFCHQFYLDIWLVGGLEHFFIFPIILGMSSSQLTFTPSFFRGAGQPPSSY